MPEEAGWGRGEPQGSTESRLAMLNDLEKRFLERSAEADRRFTDSMTRVRTNVPQSALADFDRRMEAGRAHREEIRQEFLGRIASQRARPVPNQSEDEHVSLSDEATSRRAALTNLDKLEQEFASKLGDMQRKFDEALETLRANVASDRLPSLEAEMRRDHADAEKGIRAFISELNLQRAEHLVWLAKYDGEVGGDRGN